MNKRKIWRILLLLLLICFVEGAKIEASGIGSPVKIQLDLRKMSYKSNGGSVHLNKKNRAHTKVKIQTEKEKKGYYTSYFYVEQNVEMYNHGVLAIQLETRQRLRMNGNIVKEHYTGTYQCANNTFVFSKKENETCYRGIPVENGVFEIPENFKGTVYLPIEVQKEKLSVNGVGFIVVLANNEKAEFTVNSMELSKGYELQDTAFYEKIEIKGNQIVEIPMQGQYYYQYSVKRESKQAEKVTFQLESATKEIWITPNGRLYIPFGVKPQKIHILARVGDEIEYSYEVDIVESWLEKIEGVDVRNFVVPSRNQVKQAGPDFAIPYSWICRSICLLSMVFAIFYVCKVKGR